MKIYLDVCCLNRPFDDQSQMRIHLEAEAVLAIIRQVEFGAWSWISSDAVAYEIYKTPNEERQERLWQVEQKATERLELTDEVFQQADTLQQLGFTEYDALHLAFAIHAKVDVMLSTDDKLVKRAHANSASLPIKVANPLAWLQEVI
ncbi:MAG: PIN domain-containing protein [Thiothrix sp.]|nr:MAG: PIN domain-containing protein [Thiothrix sp.]